METEARIGRIIRLTLGMVLMIYGINYFYPLIDARPDSALASELLTAMQQTGYMLPAIYGLQLILGCCIFFRLYTPIAYLLIAIIAINYFLFAVLVNKSSIMNASVLLALSGYKIYELWHKYKELAKE